MQIIYTLGHSSHSWARFSELLSLFDIGCVLDVRSRPRSRWSAFSHPNFRINLNDVGVSYLYMGSELGGQPTSGPADYSAISATEGFLEAIDKVLAIAQRCKVALVCSEHDPIQCHRFLLISRALAARGADVHHILRDGKGEPHAAALRRLQKSFPQAPLLAGALSVGWAIEAQERRLKR